MTLTDAVGTGTTFAPSGASEVDATFRLISEEVMFGVKTPEEAAQELYTSAVDIVTKAAAATE